MGAVGREIKYMQKIIIQQMKMNFRKQGKNARKEKREEKVKVMIVSVPTEKIMMMIAQR